LTTLQPDSNSKTIDKQGISFARLITIGSVLLIITGICSLLNDSVLHVAGIRKIEVFGRRTQISVGAGFIY
jgi:hypothetical protein